MVVRLFVVQNRSAGGVPAGAVLAEVEPLRLAWEVQSNTAETIRATIPMAEDRAWESLLTPWKHSLVVDVGGRLYGGPIMPHSFDDDSGSLEVTARGFRALFGTFSVRPPAVLSQPLAVDGVPDVSLDTVIGGLDLGSIGARVGRVATAGWPGRDDLPVVWPADRAGSSVYEFKAVDGEWVDEVWDHLSAVDGGPDIRILPRWADEDRVEWVYESGTAAQPRLRSDSVHAWEPGQGAGLRVTTDPSRMGSVAWSVAGRDSDTVVAAMRYDDFLVNEGFPLMELVTDASSSITETSTLEAWNVEALRTARRPWQFWTFKVRADQPPYPFEVGCGDLVDVTISPQTPVAGGYVPARREPYRRRIVGMSGDERGEWLTVTCGEAYEDGSETAS